jgi:chitinase
VPDNNDDAYKPKELAEGDPSLDRTGDFEGIKRPEFYAGVAVQGDVTARLSAAAEFGVRFADKWEIEPAAAAVVGEASVMVKLKAGVSTNAVCPFTYSLDVGARLYARVQAPQAFGWSGAEYDLTPQWTKGIFDSDTCPDLGAIPSKRDLGLAGAANYSAAHGQDYGLPPQLENAGPADDNGIQRRSGHLAKRGGVYGPVLSLPVGKFFCPPSSDPDENESSSCSDVVAAWDQDQYLNEDYEGTRRRRSEDALPGDHGDLDHVEGESLAHIHSRAITTKPLRACGVSTTFNYPTDGTLVTTGALIYGWEQPAVCGNYDWGGPLTARVAGQAYHSEHILEAQMVAQFFAYMDERTDPVANPNPNASPNRPTVSFCDYVNVMFNINPVVAPGIDTAQGFAAQLTPIRHIAAQYPTNLWNANEYVSLESVINTPAKGKAWGTNNNIIDTSAWMTQRLPTAAGARSMLKSMRSLIGSRVYHNDFTVLGILRAQKARVGAILDLLDTTVLPANPPAGFTPWVGFNLRAEWDTFMRGEFLMMQTKTMKVINDFIGPLKEQWTSDAVKQANEDQAGDSAAVLATKQGVRNLIDDIEAMDDYLRTMPAWQWAF